VAVDNSNPASLKSVLYAATGVADIAFDSRPGVGIFRSSDGGQNWTLIDDSATVFAGARISKIVVDPTDINPVYVGVASGGTGGPGVYKRKLNTTTGAYNWVLVMTTGTGGSMRDSSNKPLGPTALASVTDLVIDPFDHTRLLVGLGNI